MATKTKHLQLYKPAKNEYYDVDRDQNENFDKIDAKFGEVDNGLKEKLDKGSYEGDADDLKREIDDKEPAFSKKSGFNKEKTDYYTGNDTNKLLTQKGANDLYNKSLVFKKVINDGSDINDLKEPGLYLIGNAKNNPNSGEWTYLKVYLFNGQPRQEAIHCAGTANSTQTRNYNGTYGWSKWALVWDSGNFNPDDKLSKGGYTGNAKNLNDEISKKASSNTLGRMIVGEGLNADDSGRVNVDVYKKKIVSTGRGSVDSFISNRNNGSIRFNGWTTGNLDGFLPTEDNYGNMFVCQGGGDTAFLVYMPSHTSNEMYISSLNHSLSGNPKWTEVWTTDNIRNILGWEMELAYIQDNITKVKGKCYRDKNTKKIHLCLNTTSSTSNSEDNFLEVTLENIINMRKWKTATTLTSSGQTYVVPKKYNEVRIISTNLGNVITGVGDPHGTAFSQYGCYVFGADENYQGLFYGTSQQTTFTFKNRTVTLTANTDRDEYLHIFVR